MEIKPIEDTVEELRMEEKVYIKSIEENVWEIEKSTDKIDKFFTRNYTLLKNLQQILPQTKANSQAHEIIRELLSDYGD